MKTLVLDFKKIKSNNKTLFSTICLNSKEEIIINESGVDGVFDPIFSSIISNMQKSLGQGSGSVIELVLDHNITISKHNPLACSSRIKLPKKFDYPRKGLNNIQNIDDNKWSLVRYLHPVDYHPARIKKADEKFSERLDFIDINVPVKANNIRKIESKVLPTLAFFVMKKVKYPIYILKFFL